MTTRRYITGFALSLILTCASFGIVWAHLARDHGLISHTLLASAILVLAIIQLVIQLVYFLHFGRETKVRDILSFALAASLIVFIVIGSLWIMANLKHNEALPYHGEVTPQNSND